MTIQTQLCTFKTADNERLHGLHIWTNNGKDDRNDCRPYAKQLGCPLLAIVGGAEPKFFHEYAQDLVRASSTYRLVEGGNHFYDRHTGKIVEIIYQWLARFAR